VLPKRPEARHGWVDAMKWCLGMLLLSTGASAATDAGAVCVEVEQRVAEAQRTLAACTDTSRALSSAREQCVGQLDEARTRLGAASGQLEVCLGAKEQQCQEAALFAASLLNGHARGVNGCVHPGTVTALQTLLDGWFALSRDLQQLDEYATGATDWLPRVTGDTEPERRLARVLGLRQGSPLWNRRLLIEAFRLTAPGTWGKLKVRGVAAIEGFFESRGPLPDAVISEAQAEHGEPAGPAGAPLTAALKLTVSYLQIANCEARAGSSECGRARQLVELLDNTGPLIVRRRVDEIWATPCSAIGPETVRAWLQDFPASGREKGQAPLAELSAGARGKLFNCYLADADGYSGYRQWVSSRLPAHKALDARTLALVDDFRELVSDGDPVDRCGRAVRALQRLDAPKECGVERPEVLAAIANWAQAPAPTTPSAQWQLCSRVASLLWNGQAVVVPSSPAEPVHVDEQKTGTPVALLRVACDQRRGTGDRFERGLVEVARIAGALGEPLNVSPWRLDTQGALRPRERSRFEAAEGYGAWLTHLLSREQACEVLGMPEARCDECREKGAGTAYDCDVHAELGRVWSRYRRGTEGFAAAVAAAALLIVWLRRFRRAQRVFGVPMEVAREHLEGLGLVTSPAPWRLLMPGRRDRLEVELPRTPMWDRWGPQACVVMAPGTSALREADVNHAAAVALRRDMRVVFLLHHDSAVPDLGAVRATLDWAARGGTKAVQVLPLALSRLAWATREEDLLDLVESTTLRGNPFEVRGPVRSSSQFWNRERLVSGLLTQARAGNWVVVTGLRRFGKSSLALEVARRTTGPSAYVDLAGFHHEVSFGESPAVAVEAILRTLAMRLVEAAKDRYPAAELPAPPLGVLDAPALAGWLGALATACGSSSGTPPPPILLVLDEVEQLLSATPESLGRALDVLSTLTGRLRSALANPSSPHSQSSVSVLLCAAVHPLLWAPLATLGGQSLMGAFPSVCVPVLDDDAARAMMRGLGARQGIRFEDDALLALVRASHGVPLLLRQLGTSVLELYDADRAREGALGAVRIGIEGANEAIRREERAGSPLRVWVESEIARADTGAGVMLRALAQASKVSVDALHRMGEALVMEGFEAVGLGAHLAPAELRRRAQEAASVMVRLLIDSRLVESHGDVTSPDALSLPDGVLRRILKEGRTR
jgi:hypothetical protein